MRDLFCDFPTPNRGLRLFISTTAATTSFEGPLGPARARFPGEYNHRYLQRTSVWGNRVKPDGLRMTAATRSVHIAGITINPNKLFMRQIDRNLTDVVDGFLLDKRYLLTAERRIIGPLLMTGLGTLIYSRQQLCHG
ncbi:MAG: hypothetical protein ACREPG_02830 [Candidatus Binatia bacterium]